MPSHFKRGGLVGTAGRFADSRSGTEAARGAWVAVRGKMLW